MGHIDTQSIPVTFRKYSAWYAVCQPGHCSQSTMSGARRWAADSHPVHPVMAHCEHRVNNHLTTFKRLTHGASRAHYLRPTVPGYRHKLTLLPPFPASYNVLEYDLIVLPQPFKETPGALPA
jgi:hypothetical protein